MEHVTQLGMQDFVVSWIHIQCFKKHSNSQYS